MLKNIRLLPAFITLLAGAVTSISLCFTEMELYMKLLILFLVLVVFYVLGVIAMRIIQSCPPKEETDSEGSGEGEVIQKENTEGQKAEDKEGKSEK